MQYNLGLSQIPTLQLPTEREGCINSFWMYTIILPTSLSAKRDGVINLLMQNGIESRPVFFPMHNMPPYADYKQCGNEYPISNRLSEGGISLPSSVEVGESEIQRVCDVLSSCLEKLS